MALNIAMILLKFWKLFPLILLVGAISVGSFFVLKWVFPQIALILIP